MRVTREAPISRASPLIVLALFCALGVVLRVVHLPPVPSFALLVNALDAVAATATVLLLAVRMRTEANRLALWWLIGMFVTLAIISATRAIFAPVLPATNGPPVGAFRATVWLFSLASMAFIAGACVFVMLRRRPPFEATRFVASAIVAGAALAAAALIVLALRTPTGWLLGGSIVGAAILRSGVGPLCVLVGLVAVMALAWRSTERLDRAVALSVLAFCFALVLEMISPGRYSVPYYAARLMSLIAALAVVLATIRDLLLARQMLAQAQADSTRANARSIAMVERLRGLWTVATDAHLGDDERFRALLDVGIRTLRPGRRFGGVIAHLEGEDSVFDMVVFDTLTERTRSMVEVLTFPGAAIPFGRTLQAQLYAHGRAMGWSDLDALDDASLMFPSIGWKSYIGAPFHVDRTTYFLFFASDEALIEDPFDEDDYAFVDVLAAFAHSRFSMQKQVERIKFQIEHDALTGLPNRTQFRLRVRQMLGAADRFAVAMIDLDDFSRLNAIDTYQLGDEVLVEVASELRAVDARDFVARLSGDDFGLILPQVESHDELATRIARYSAVFGTPFAIGDATGNGTRTVQASIGAVISDIVERPTVDALLQRVDFMVATASSQGGARTIVFDKSMGEMFSSRMVLRDELVNAIETNELELWYQPTVDIATGDLRGAEGLVRWRHPVHGLIMPGDFIPFAESNGLIRSLGRWVLRRAVRDLASAAVIPPRFRCYVNLSSYQLGDDHFLADVREHLETYPNLASHLGIEITETAAVRNVERSKYVFTYLQRYGLKIALDDFGTEYSSLAYLKDLPLDVIKIDRTFVSGLPQDEKDGALCETLLSIGARFQIDTLAEGIETVEQRDWLRSRGCLLGQGYLFARPMAWTNFREGYLDPAEPVGTSAVRRA